ncbi:MAG: response regulator transcription factor [Alistipes sp.]|jgi:DNA-binding NarL/FixJ family response regulator|nr:response regulator transcription factor [Alistipes sp.]
MVKIAIVDDHTLFRNGLKGLLSAMSDYQIVGDYSDGSEFIAALPRLDVDVVLMDISMPNMDGKTATVLALQQRPELKVVALTMFGEQQYIQQMVSAGVKGFINKDSDIHIVCEAINAVVRGEEYIPYYQSPASLSGADELTERELAVLTCICKGLSTPQIAEQLNISKRTVDAHRARILEKTGCNNTASLVVHAVTKLKILS